MALPRRCIFHEDTCIPRSCLLLLFCSTCLAVSALQPVCVFKVSEFRDHLFTLLCTFSICCCSLLRDGTQAALPYSSTDLTRLVYRILMVNPSLYVYARLIIPNILFVYARLIIPNILFALLVTVSTCWLNFKSGSICTPRSHSFVVTPILVPLSI